MEDGESNTLFYKRSHFATHLPLDRLYSASHYWLFEKNGTWRVGWTKFATHLLGEVVDYGFDIQLGAAVETGQVLGWIEGFKAVSDLLCLIDGKFIGSNPQLSENPEAIGRDCYGAGWLYEATGKSEFHCLNAQEYAVLLDTTIDKLVEKQSPTE